MLQGQGEQIGERLLEQPAIALDTAGKEVNHYAVLDVPQLRGKP